MKKRISSLSFYLIWGAFIACWWSLAFHQSPAPAVLSFETSSSLSLKTASLLNELSPLDRATLQQALAGDFPAMIRLIDQWDQDTLLLLSKGVKGVERLPPESFLQAHVLGHLLTHSSQESLRKLNCRMNLDQIHDDQGHCLRIEDSFRRFLPQTYLAASFLLAIAPPEEIVALPRGLRELKQLYPSHLLNKVPADSGLIRSEELVRKKPDLAFVAPYSHPPSLEVLRNRQIALYSIGSVNTIQEIQEALLKVGHASNHILEAQLLALFMEASLLAIDNRFCAMQDPSLPQTPPRSCLYLTHRQHYALPTAKCLTGQLMTRALSHCSSFIGNVPDSQTDWSIPFEQEKIVQSDPAVMIVSTPGAQPDRLNLALQATEAYKTNKILYVDEAVQDSPTQYIVLAYYDLYHALASL